MKMMKLTPALALVLAGALAASGAFASSGMSSRAADGTPAAEIRMEMGEYFFSPAKLQLVGGLPYVLRLENIGALEHEFDAPALAGVAADSWVEVFGPDGKVVAKIFGVPEEMILAPGESAAWHFTPLHALEAGIVCDLPGHREAGMTGRVLVRAAPN